jgi:glyceraldehyde 3-phosphate dehydrogenase
LKYDSSHGKFRGTIEKVDEHNIKVNGKNIRVYNEMKPADIKWGDCGVKIVAESSGAFLSQEKA